MYRLACKSREIEAACRKPSCVYPDICDNLGTDHAPLIALYRKARALPGIKRVLIASGVRYDLAVRSPEWIRELAQHHTGGYLKIAPEHTEDGPLRHMMKPGIGAYDRFKELFDRYSQRGGQGAVPDPVLHRRPPRHHRRGHAEPGAVAQAATASAPTRCRRSCRRRWRARPRCTTPGSTRCARSRRARPCPRRQGRWSGAGSTRRSCATTIPRTGRCCARRCARMGRADLIGGGKHAPRAGVAAGRPGAARARRRVRPGTALTQHTGLPPHAPQAAGPMKVMRVRAGSHIGACCSRGSAR